MTLLYKELILFRNPKIWKIGRSDSRQVWKNNLEKAMAQKGLFYHNDDDYYYDLLIIMIFDGVQSEQVSERLCKSTYNHFFAILLIFSYIVRR
jgi:hypothetical protein